MGSEMKTSGEASADRYARGSEQHRSGTDLDTIPNTTRAGLDEIEAAQHEPSLRERLTSSATVEVVAREAFRRARTDFEYDWDATADQWRADARALLETAAGFLEMPRDDS